MNAISEPNPVLAPLQRLTQRVRLKRWLGKSLVLVWLVALLFVGVYLADIAIGLRTLTLRICLATFAFTVGVFLVGIVCTSWFARLDLLGIAHLLEKRHPALAERLLTLVQMDAEPTANVHPKFIALLRHETSQQLATVEPEAACPLARERRAWLITATAIGIAFVGLCFAPSFREFSQRYLSSWATSLTPYRIELSPHSSYALRGTMLKIDGRIVRQDPYAPALAECQLVAADDSDRILATSPIDAERFAFLLEGLNESVHCLVSAGDAKSAPIEITLVEAPKLTATPKFTVTPPKYLAKRGVKSFELEANGPPVEVLQYSKWSVTVSLDQSCGGQLFLETSDAAYEVPAATVPLQAGADVKECHANVLAAKAGTARAVLRLDLAHGLVATIPLGTIQVVADQAPHFTKPLRFVGSGSRLQSVHAYRIAADDALRLETEVADREGLSAIDVEYRLNDNAPHVVPWIDAEGKQTFAIQERLPMPKGLKQGDRVLFRLRVRDNRELRRGEVDAQAMLPPFDLHRQTAFAPDDAGGEDAWIQLYVDSSKDSDLKQQAEAQSEEVRGLIDGVKKKIVVETQQVEKMKRSIHLQAALTLDQRMQADKLQAMNREIVEDLLRAGQRLALNPELGRLAEHFLDVAENEMQKAGDALAKFGEKDRPLASGEKELHVAHDALMNALKKLERLNDWSKMLAQDRLDQQQLDNLAQRQQDLADRLEEMRLKEGLSDAELAKQIEEIRQEQARIAQKTEQLKDENRLVQNSLAAMERQRVEKLAQDAQKLAADQRAQREMSANQMPAEIKERLQDLARRQSDLAKRMQSKPATEAADALRKPNLELAIHRQTDQEKQLQDELGKLLPGVVANELREQIMRLAGQQKEIRTNLERVGMELAQLPEDKLKERLKALVARQRNLQSAIGKLPIDGKDQPARAGQQVAEQSAQKAAELLAVKDALQAFFSMEKTQQELEALAGALPQTLAKDRRDIKDPGKLAKLKQTEEFADHQQKLRKETEKLMGDWMKAIAKQENGPVRDQMEKLTKDLLELAQKGTNPAAKAMAQETAAALDDAKKAMAAAKDSNAKGETAKMENAEAAKKLEVAVKQLEKFARDQDMKSMNKDEPGKAAEAIGESAEQMKIAEAKLPTSPKDAQTAMQAAAQKLAQAANQASMQSSHSLPKAARNPAAKANRMPGSGNARLPNDQKLESFQGKAWGELPGELKTRMIQDYRARYGDEYAEVIQQYFERLAQTPETRPKGQ